ncbi:hypothetical protein KOY48_00720 [Candidatus Minimicrobia naudis]|uniref:Uncharacterized protein n=1 Tax=Candidatus Minimicrobia naudis TaxID=2841263 RepID=A0A8F1MCR6_9BACT|nr:hypothetical protein KOY48_00720 [Candidatus Minimicrobia naudis]
MRLSAINKFEIIGRDKWIKNTRQSGAVSLFTVIFGPKMPLTIVTIGFIKLMIMDQRQSSNNDLAQSAYDAALAGVEKCKPWGVSCRPDGQYSESGRTQSSKLIVIWSRHPVLLECSSSGETIIKTGTDAGKKFDQAYTLA